MVNIFDTLRQRSERRRADELNYMSRQYVYSKDNVIYVAGVPVYTIADEADGEWVKTPSQAEAFIARLRSCFVENSGGERYLR